MTSEARAGRGSLPAPRLTAAEAVAVALLLLPATAILASYAIDLSGLRFLPWAILLVSVGVSVAIGVRLWRLAIPDPPALRTFAAVVATLFAWLLWIARPSLLPVGTGPDLTHHLLLIRYLEEQWRLVHDADIGRFLGEMTEYTPGSHLLAALAGAWSGTDGLRALHPVLAATVALKAGFLLLIVLRLLRRDVPRVPLAICGVLLLLAAPRYFLGAFAEFGFVAQVAAELFIVAMWWAIVDWDAAPRPGVAAIFGIAAASAFLTWPIYVGPPVLAFFFTIVLRTEPPLSTRVRHAAAAFVPLVAAAAAHIAGRIGWLQLAGTGGTAPWPSVDAYSVPLVTLAVLGGFVGFRSRRARGTVLFTAATGLQILVLWVLARQRGADRPYMALKLFYLLLWPMAAWATVALGEAWHLARRFAASLLPRASFRTELETAAAVALAAGVAASVVAPLMRSPRSVRPLPPAVSMPLYDAGRWARVHVPPDCVEYLVGDDETAYWLHLAVLGNPRVSERTGNNETFELNAAIIRWLTPGGLRYAIADLDALPRDIRNELRVIARFGGAAVAERQGGVCPGEP